VLVLVLVLVVLVLVVLVVLLMLLVLLESPTQLWHWNIASGSTLSFTCSNRA
jgi:hypothetical protein